VQLIALQEHYKKRRAEAYPPIGDQLDAIWKALAGLDWRAWPKEVTDMMAAIAAVKTKYPKKL